MGFWYWSKIIGSCWLKSLCWGQKNSIFPFLPRYLQSCQSRYTHEILMLVKEYMFLLAEKLMPGAEKLSCSLLFHDHCKAVKVDTIMGFWYWSKINCSCWLKILCWVHKNSLFPFLPHSLQSCQSRYTHGILILVKDYMFLLTEKLKFGAEKKSLFPSLPHSLQSCQSRYTHGVLILVIEYMFLLAKKLMLGAQKLSFPFPTTIMAELIM